MLSCVNSIRCPEVVFLNRLTTQHHTQMRFSEHI